MAQLPRFHPCAGLALVTVLFAVGSAGQEPGAATLAGRLPVAQGLAAALPSEVVAVRFDGDGQEDLGGLGLAVAFDSRAVRFVGVEGLFRDDLLAVTEAPEADSGDVDGNPATDRLIRIAWLAPLGEWAGAHEGVLARLGFVPIEAGGDVLAHLSATSLSPSVRGVVHLALAEASAGRRAAARRHLGWAPARVPGVETLEVASAGAVATTCSLDVDGNGRLDALTDGILIMRHLFGFSGSALTASAVGPGATRASADAIITFLGGSSCAGMLDADGNGTRDALTDGILAARYLFGFTGTTLVGGALGAGATRTDSAAVVGFLAMFRSGEPVLALLAPSLAAPVLSQLPVTLRVGTTYTGSRGVTYALAQSPAGMTIDANSGTLGWTPPASLEGQQATVKVTATDGALNAEVTFTVRVAAVQPVTTSLSGQTVTVTQTGTLKDLSFTFPSQATVPLTQVKVSSVAASQAPPVPATFTRISDFFRVTPVAGSNGMITITMPATALPGGRQPQDLRLVLWLDGITDTVGSPEAPFWSATWLDLRVLASGKVTIQLKGLGDLAFIGVQPPPLAATAFVASAPTPLPAEGVTATYACVPKALPNGQTDANQQVCTVTGSTNLTVTVKNPTDLRTTPASTIQDLLGALAVAKAKFDGYGLRTDPAFEVSIDGTTTNGYVTTRNQEDRKVLHITNQQIAQKLLRVISAHEFFHHAQARTTEVGKGSVIEQGDSGKWLTEGTARWFDDEFDDTFDSYRMTEAEPLPRVLEVGLAVRHAVATARNQGGDRRSGYARFGWFKLLESACSGFSPGTIVNSDAATDPTGIANLKARIESETWQCDFGPGFGEDNRRTFANALLYYTYATVKADDISQLDGGEAYFKFRGLDGLAAISPAESCTPADPCPGSLVTVLLAPASTTAFVVDPVSPVPEGMIATLWATTIPDGGEVWAWAGDAEKLLSSIGEGRWAVTTDGGTMAYGDATRAPKMLVVLVNPSATAAVKVEVRAGFASGVMIASDPIVEPLIDFGRPNRVYGFGAYGPAQVATTRYVWDFGDGTPKVTVDGNSETTHTFTREGTFTVKVELSDRVLGTRLGSAVATARIAWFHGSYPITNFTLKSSTGTVTWPEVWADEAAVLNAVLANPTSGRIEFYYSSGGLAIWLQVSNFTSLAGTGSPAGWDIPSFLTITGNQLVGRSVRYGYMPSDSNLTYATLWFDTTLTQSNAILAGETTLVCRVWDQQAKQAVETGRRVYTVQAKRRE